MFFAGRSLGVEIYQDGCSFLLASGRRVAPVIDKFETAVFPADSLRLSIKETNIADPAVLQPLLAEAYTRLGTDLKRVSLSIPDLAGRIMMLEMDSLPKSREEGIEHVKWKLKKSFPVDLNDMHLDYQPLAASEQGGAKVIAAVVSRGVISGYEDLFTAIGLEPAFIDFSTFNLYRLFAEKLEIQDDLTLVILFRGNLTVMVFQDGFLDFHRSKSVIGSTGDPVRLYREVNSSLLVYSDSRGGVKPQRIFYFSAPAERHLLRSVIFEAATVEPLLIDTDNLISGSRQQVDRTVLPEILSALGAATRGLA
jgi:type IV pilus assembly protein PilM